MNGPKLLRWCGRRCACLPESDRGTTRSSRASERGRHLLRRVLRFPCLRADIPRRCARSAPDAVGAFGLAAGLLALAELVVEACGTPPMSGLAARRRILGLGPGPPCLRSSSIISTTVTMCLWPQRIASSISVFGHLAGEALDHGDRRARAGQRRGRDRSLPAANGSA